MLNLVEYNKAQVKEINDYIWFKGIELGYNPTNDKSREELELEWVMKYAVSFAMNNRSKYEMAEQVA